MLLFNQYIYSKQNRIVYFCTNYNEWINECPSISIQTDMCERTGNELHWSIMLITSDSLNVCVCITIIITDRSHW